LRKGGAGYARGEEVVLGHSVERLCADAARYDAEFRRHVRRWAILDGYYVPTRYPNSVPDSIPARVYTQDAAMSAVALATEVVTEIRNRLTQ
jgi:HEPN domain-containing protein